jgi:hypothetical protein
MSCVTRQSEDIHLQLTRPQCEILFQSDFEPQREHRERSKNAPLSAAAQ